MSPAPRRDWAMRDGAPFLRDRACLERERQPFALLP
jgi:hypothetical protein